MSRNLADAIQIEQSARLERIERGRQAVQAASFIMEPIMRSRERVLRKLINAYRSGEASHDLLLGGIAEITALDTLIIELNHVQTQGEIAAEQEYKHDNGR